jgi:arylsulfatase A-like enzyme
MKLLKCLAAIPFALLGLATNAQEDTQKPNVIIILTDDQGYGDIASHGHPHVITPNMDRLRDISVRLENFHVDPTCAPTRASLMTGRYSARVGVWHTIIGRNLVREDETTIAEVFRDAGYRTGMFGKWHLGDTYPYGARFRGFDDAIVHYAGGVGQTPDYWGNDYFEDHFNDNGVWRRFQGYCTDVWFDEALRFIRESRDQPFFLYLSTNAAHQTRQHVPERYKQIYKDVDTNDRLRIYWGMITNIDDNLGVMMERLGHWGLLNNTIILFMSDNGSCMGQRIYPEEQQDEWSERFNAGMKGNKSSHYEGGHRVFCFAYYPPAGIAGGRDINQVTAHIDIMPTLLDLCNIPEPDSIQFDGTSLVPLLKGNGDDWPERTMFVHNQRVLDPIKWKQTSVMTDNWRLIDNKELYDISTDPGQENDLIAAYPEIANRLSNEYESLWEDLSQRFGETTPLYIGAKQENPVVLNAHDWMIDEHPPWNQPHILNRPVQNGPWRVKVAESGKYQFVLRERPEVANFPLTATGARLRIGNQVDERLDVTPGATGVYFDCELQAGDTDVQTWLTEDDGTAHGAFFVEVTRIE